jgi:hypothetical protein
MSSHATCAIWCDENAFVMPQHRGRSWHNHGRPPVSERARFTNEGARPVEVGRVCDAVAGCDNAAGQVGARRLQNDYTECAGRVRTRVRKRMRGR